MAVGEPAQRAPMTMASYMMNPFYGCEWFLSLPLVTICQPKRSLNPCIFRDARTIESESHYEDVGRRLFLLQISNDVTRKITSLPWRRDHAKLLQEAQGIPLAPDFDSLLSN